MTINAWLIDMPTKIKGLTSKNEDDSYTVLINSRLNYEQRMKAYAHELMHIKNGDFDMFDVQEIEIISH